MEEKKTSTDGPGMGPKAGLGAKRGAAGEKVPKGTWGKLIRYCKKYIAVMIVALACASFGTVLTLIGPDKLSEITDVITEGIAPNTDVLEEVSASIAENMVSNMEDISAAVSENMQGNMVMITDKVSANIQANMQAVITAISDNLSNQGNRMENAAADIEAPSAINVDGHAITVEEQIEAFRILSGLDMEDEESVTAAMGSLPDSVKSAIYTEIEVNGILISGRDQQAMMDAFAGPGMEGKGAALENMENLPASVMPALFTKIEVNGVGISGDDQQAMMDALDGADMDNADDRGAMPEWIGRLPESVKSAMYTEITVAGNKISGEDQEIMAGLLSNIDEDDTDAVLDALDRLPESIYDMIKPSVDLGKVADIAFLLAALYVIGILLSSAQGVIMATVTQKVSKSLRGDISRKINRLPLNYYNRHSTGDVLSRVTNDVDTIGMTLNMSVGNLVSALTLFIGSLIMMLKTNLIMTAAGVAATILGFALMMAIMSKSQKYFVRQQRHLGAVNGHIEEIYSGHIVVKAYNGEEAAKKEFKELNGRLRDSGFKAQALSGLMMPLMTFVGNFGYVTVCIAGAALALNGSISFGVIVAFIMYIRFFTQPLAQIAQAAQSLQSAGAAASRVFEFLGEEEMEDEANKTAGLTSALGNVSFSHVRFSYPDAPEKIIINDFSAEAKAGQKIAVVGPTGAGKTTLVNLLMRFYEINGGDIKIDGVSTASMKREDVHSQFCMVLQDTWLFEGTVKENLIYCSENGTEEKMRAACREVGLDHFIRTLPQGYDTVLDDSVSLSQGQKQQLTIARAMIADKPILILDEATSSIDTRTEQKIQAAMDELMDGRTSFVIAHRLSTIKNADLILVLKDGDVIESGNHEELMKRDGFYADLYNSQFEQTA